MQQKKNCDFLPGRKDSTSQAIKIMCGLFLCLPTGIFAMDENLELLTSSWIENRMPDQAEKTVTVMVRDETGPVIGANVVVKGTTIGNISDDNGMVILPNIPDNSS